MKPEGFIARMKRLRRPLPRPRPERTPSGKWALFYDQEGRFREALDLAESCTPFEMNDRCGGCSSCLSQQAHHYGGRVEYVNAAECPRPCPLCCAAGYLVGVADGTQYPCERCNAFGAVW